MERPDVGGAAGESGGVPPAAGGAEWFLGLARGRGGGWGGGCGWGVGSWGVGGLFS